MEEEEVFGLNETDAASVIDLLTPSESADLQRPRRLWRHVLLYTTTAITAFDGTTLGTGKGRLSYISGTATPTLFPSEIEYDVLSIRPYITASGRWVLAIREDVTSKLWIC